MAFYMDALEVLRQLVVAIGSDLFLDSMVKLYEKIAQADCKAKGQKIYFHKIRPPNSFSIRNPEFDSLKAKKVSEPYIL